MALIYLLFSLVQLHYVRGLLEFPMKTFDAEYEEYTSVESFQSIRAETDIHGRDIPTDFKLRFGVGGVMTDLRLTKNQQMQKSVSLYSNNNGQIKRKNFNYMQDIHCYQDRKHDASLCTYQSKGCTFMFGSFVANGTEYMLEYPRTRCSSTITEDGTLLRIWTPKDQQLEFDDATERGPNTRKSLNEYNSLFNHHREKRATGNYTIELFMVTDYSVYEYWFNKSNATTNAQKKIDAEKSIYQYMAWVVNGLDMRYLNIQSSFTLSVKFVDLYIAETVADSVWTEPYKDASYPKPRVDSQVALDKFREWTTNTSGLPQYDHAMLFTAYDFTSGGSTGNAGKAFLGEMCTANSLSVIEFKFNFVTVTIAAHELGHGLNANHDGYGNSCSRIDKYIMANTVSVHTGSTARNLFLFSVCSVDSFRNILTSLNSRQEGNCLLIHSPDYQPTALAPYQQNPGQSYTADQQCQNIEGEGSYLCRSSYDNNFTSICTGLSCADPAQPGYCKLSLSGDGTQCGNKKWCINGLCIHSDQAPSGDDTCLYGDEPGIIYNGKTCSEIARDSKYLCYTSLHSLIVLQCCASCNSVKTGIPNCEYGNKNPQCRPECVYTGSSAVICCESCYVPPTTTTSSTPTSSWNITSTSTTLSSFSPVQSSTSSAGGATTTIVASTTINLTSHSPPTTQYPSTSATSSGIVDVNQQCINIKGVGSYLCKTLYNNNYTNICTYLHCALPSQSGYCSNTISSSINHILCGNKKWCIGGSCTYSEDAPNVDESCLYGDTPGFVHGGVTCGEIAQTRNYMCYDSYVFTHCCTSCASVRTGIPDCMYGNKNPSCKPECVYVGDSAKICCESCYVSTSTALQTSTPPSTTADFTTISSSTNTVRQEFTTVTSVSSSTIPLTSTPTSASSTVSHLSTTPSSTTPMVPISTSLTSDSAVTTESGSSKIADSSTSSFSSTSVLPDSTFTTSYSTSVSSSSTKGTTGSVPPTISDTSFLASSSTPRITESTSKTTVSTSLALSSTTVTTKSTSPKTSASSQTSLSSTVAELDSTSMTSDSKSIPSSSTTVTKSASSTIPDSSIISSSSTSVMPESTSLISDSASASLSSTTETSKSASSTISDSSTLSSSSTSVMPESTSLTSDPRNASVSSTTVTTKSASSTISDSSTSSSSSTSLISDSTSASLSSTTVTTKSASSTISDSSTLSSSSTSLMPESTALTSDSTSASLPSTTVTTKAASSTISDSSTLSSSSTSVMPESTSLTSDSTSASLSSTTVTTKSAPSTISESSIISSSSTSVMPESTSLISDSTSASLSSTTETTKSASSTISDSSTLSSSSTSLISDSTSASLSSTTVTTKSAPSTISDSSTLSSSSTSLMPESTALTSDSTSASVSSTTVTTKSASSTISDWPTLSSSSTSLTSDSTIASLSSTAVTTKSAPSTISDSSTLSSSSTSVMPESTALSSDLTSASSSSTTVTTKSASYAISDSSTLSSSSTSVIPKSTSLTSDSTSASLSTTDSASSTISFTTTVSPSSTLVITEPKHVSVSSTTVTSDSVSSTISDSSTVYLSSTTLIPESVITISHSTITTESETSTIDDPYTLSSATGISESTSMVSGGSTTVSTISSSSATTTDKPTTTSYVSSTVPFLPDVTKEIFVLSFVMNVDTDINIDLSDKGSEDYKRIYVEVEISLVRLYKNELKGLFLAIIIINISRGSLVVDHQVIMKNESASAVQMSSLTSNLIKGQTNIVYNGSAVSTKEVTVVSKTGVKVQLTDDLSPCEIFLKLDTCQENHYCSSNDNVPTCIPRPLSDGLDVLIGLSVSIPLVFIIGLVLSLAYIHKKKMKRHRNTTRNRVCARDDAFPADFVPISTRKLKIKGYSNGTSPATFHNNRMILLDYPFKDESV